MGRIRLNTEKITKLGLIALAISLFVLMLRGCAIARGGYEGDSDAPTADGDDATVSIYNADTDKVYSLPLEEYVLRVTAAEMPASFAEEALKAQSVAARTYTARKMASLGGKPCGKGGADVCTDSTCCQGWLSPEARKASWGDGALPCEKRVRQAVSATAGQVLT